MRSIKLLASGMGCMHALAHRTYDRIQNAGYMGSIRMGKKASGTFKGTGDHDRIEKRLFIARSMGRGGHSSAGTICSRVQRGNAAYGVTGRGWRKWIPSMDSVKWTVPNCHGPNFTEALMMQSEKLLEHTHILPRDSFASHGMMAVRPS
jgi:hypothetical protein